MALIAGAKDVGLSPSIVGSLPRKEATLVELVLLWRLGSFLSHLLLCFYMTKSSIIPPFCMHCVLLHDMKKKKKHEHGHDHDSSSSRDSDYVQQYCINSGVSMGKYFCATCKLFDDDDSVAYLHLGDEKAQSSHHPSFCNSSIGS
ncbi:E3 ubiquitin-protein ligase SRFP1-like isoform X5 [Lotus japonicus]|uniref:E3 ubiquitin-protein ligase SRFP1-like isoform X5 n=1 Tax=Lotus japonicus TaxID=34305 RepID=UPI0025880ED2|nr:E3 ubiquitin-protein ligase SRFP1-like isoform X5 [Lotus japonicus]